MIARRGAARGIVSRRIGARLVGMGIALAAALAGGLSPAGGQGEAIATLDPVQGLVQRRTADAAEDAWETAAERVPVAAGDWIRTGPNGLATVTFFEGVQAEIRPGALIRVETLSADVDPGTAELVSFSVTLDMLVGDTLSRLDRALDVGSAYEVRTPGSTLAVRGTEFFTSVSPDGETRVSVLSGRVMVRGMSPEGFVTAEALLGPEDAIVISPQGELRMIQPIGPLPTLPAEAPIAPDTCGDGVCQQTEQANQTCAADCTELPHCGDGACNLHGGENAVSCPADCVPNWPEPVLNDLHFYWGGMRCDFTPEPPISGPLYTHWGIGCFDSSVQASAHPHPADYQLEIDGQPADMSSLRQSGPHIHLPDCPWGWTFTLGPIQLPPGTHILTLTETSTDTWEAESGGHTAGDVAVLECRVEVK